MQIRRQTGIEMIRKVYLESGRCWLGLDEKGALWSATGLPLSDQDWEAIQFNEVYRGYYPACRFTAIVTTEKDFVAVGIGADHLPYVYRSMMGGVWESADLLCRRKEGGYERASSEILDVFYDRKNRQLFFPCRNGELITMPDCPKCMKLTQVSKEPLIKARWSGEVSEPIVLTCESGREVILPLNQISQFQVTRSYAVEKLEKGGYWVDVSGQRLERQSEIDDKKQLHMELDSLSAWLNDISKETCLFFCCKNGTRAEFASYLARQKGYRYAYCIGKGD